MKNIKKTIQSAVALTVLAGVNVVAPSVTHAARPIVETDHGAFVRIVGNPLDGTIKFQYGWADDTDASDAAGYWIGVYDVTHSHYVWNTDTGPVNLPSALKRNAHPTADLPNGDYKVVFFVRDTYDEPVTNISEIELPFTVHQMID